MLMNLSGLLVLLGAAAPLPCVDLSDDTARQVVIAQGTETIYQGHPTTVLLPDGQTMYCVWTYGHGGVCGPLKRSADGGRTWSDLLPVPESWTTAKNCSAIYRLPDPQGKMRLVVYASTGPDGTMHRAVSEDDGRTWGDMLPTGLTCVMPLCTVVPIDGGARLLGMSNLRRPGEKQEKRSNVVAQSYSTDGGLSWTPWKIVCDMAGLAVCEPALVRSPDGKQLLCLLRENYKAQSMFMTSDDEGAHWSEARPLPLGLVGDRHMPCYAADGRLVVCMRDKTKAFGTLGHFVAWVGRYEDIVAGRDGQYRVKLLHSYAGSDCGYPGLERLPDDTLVATTYIKYRPGAEKQSVVSTRFRLSEIDKLAAGDAAKSQAEGAAPSKAARDETRPAQMAAAVAVSPLAPKGTKPSAPNPPPKEPVHLARAAQAGDVDGKTYDLVVVGGTGSGVLCAVRAAREGCSVLLVQHNRHIGGMMTNGLMQWDALYGGHRAPLFSELLRNIERHYIATYGENSPEHQTMRYTHEHYPISWAEPHVAEREFNRLVASQPKITLLLEHYPVAVTRDGALLRSVTLQQYAGAGRITVRGTIFADATYEGDLFAVAHVPYRCGREARDEYGEPHAGKIFVNILNQRAPQDAIDGRLNIRPYGAQQGSIDPTSPFTADRAVQAYNYRFCVTKDPRRRILPAAPPPGYNREEYVNYNRKSIATNAGPNQSSHMNSPILPGENHDYPEADWPTREKIIQRHLNFALGLMYFLQNDESVPPAQREKFRQWGLPRDEFTDHDHVPYEMYVREARRIVGRHVYTEHDNSLAPGLGRTPIHPDAIAVTDWYMDSHACTTDSRPEYHYDGKLILTAESRPGQIPYRALLPQGIDNLLVPVCLSATHIAWGAVRLEPVWMQTGESAGFAAAQAVRRRTTAAGIDVDQLIRTLVEQRVLVAFFNDVAVRGPEPWIPAVEYLAGRGFFANYDAGGDRPLTADVARTWAKTCAKLAAGTAYDATAEARALPSESSDAPIATVATLLAELQGAAPACPDAVTKAAAAAARMGLVSTAPLGRGDACRLIYAALAPASAGKTPH